MNRNARPEWIGIGVRNHPESVSGMAQNTHPWGSTRTYAYICLSLFSPSPYISIRISFQCSLRSQP